MQVHGAWCTRPGHFIKLRKTKYDETNSFTSRVAHEDKNVIIGFLKSDSHMGKSKHESNIGKVEDGSRR